MTWISHRGFVSAVDKRPALFANRVMASIFTKMSIGVILFIIIALLSDKAEVIPFTICFLVSYLAFNIYGTLHAMRLKDANGKGSKEDS